VTPLRLLHTADWHLGQTWHDHPRDFEHGRFLEWLLDLLERERVDALLVAGDVFDAASPPPRALAAWFTFLAALRRRFARLQVVAIAGNHDSGARLEAPRDVLGAFGVHVVGGLARRSDGSIDPARHVVPLRDAGGRPRALALAVPYLRPHDVRSDAGGDLQDGVVAVYRELVARAGPEDLPLVAMGHLSARGARFSRDSERTLPGGDDRALDAEAIAEGFAYTALGHLHLAQSVGPKARYSGSPIPLALAERSYEHQVCLVEVEAGGAAVQAVPVPRSVPVRRIPEVGAAPLGELLDRLRALPTAGPGEPPEALPWLEAAVALSTAEPGLRQRVEEALAGRARLVRIAPADRDSRERAEPPPVPLSDLDPAALLEIRWREVGRGGHVPPAVAAAFQQLLDDCRREVE
jgi:exonuclease SbcD